VEQETKTGLSLSGLWGLLVLLAALQTK